MLYIYIVSTRHIFRRLFLLVLFQPSDDLFAIDALTGQITCLVSLDREDQPGHHLLVQATSSVEGRRATSTAPVTVHVSDVNDHRPVFDFPNVDNHRVLMSAFTPKDFVVAKVSSKLIERCNFLEVPIKDFCEFYLE